MTERAPSIWAIDSRPEVLKRIEAVLSSSSLPCELFSDARRVVLYARQELPDLVVLGLSENTIAPEELLSMGREFDALKEVPVIVVFSEEDAISVEEALERSAMDAVALERLEQELVLRVKWQLRSSPLASKVSARSTAPRPAGLSVLRSFDFLTRVIHASPNAIVAARRDGEIVLFNRAAENILGWTKAEAIGMSVRKLYPPGGAERIMRMIHSEEHGGAGHVESVREVVVNTAGELIPVEISAALVMEEGDEIGTVGIFTDLRHQVRMEERLQQAIEALEHTQRQAVVAEVAGAAAHKLNQPLTSLLGYAELLRRQVDEEDELFRVVNTISEDARRIAEIVRKIGRITKYRTRDYAGGNKIMDLEESSSPENGTTTTVELERFSPTSTGPQGGDS